MPVQQRKTGDRRIAIAMLLKRPDGSVVDPTGLTVLFTMKNPDGTDKVPETATNVTIHPTTDFTADATTDELTAIRHRLQNGDELVLSTTGTLPAGLSTGTRYFVVSRAEDTFKLSASKGGSVIDVTDAGTGIHSFARVGSVQYAPDAADVDTPGSYRCYFVLQDGSGLKEHFPAAEEYVEKISDE